MDGFKGVISDKSETVSVNGFLFCLDLILCDKMELVMNESVRRDKPLWHISYAIIYAHVFVLAFAVHLLLKEKAYILPSAVFWIEAILAGVLLGLMIVSMFRKKASTIWWEVMLTIIAFAGVWIVLIAVFPFWLAVLCAAFLTVTAFSWFASYTINLLYAVGCTGIGLLAVWHLPASAMVFLSLGVLLYDYYRASEMKMALLYHDARKSGLVPGFLLPVDYKGWIDSRIQTWNPGKGKVVSLLPLITASGIGFHVLWAYGELAFLFFCIFVMLFGLAYGLTKDFTLRSNMFLGTAVFVFIILIFVDKL
jgi:hypothetical protein